MKLTMYNGKSLKDSIKPIYVGNPRNEYGNLKQPDKYGVTLNLISYDLLDEEQIYELIQLLRNDKLKITIERGK